MAAYNADIRIGVIGKAELNKLDAQINNLNKKTLLLQKRLQLKTKQAAVRLDTRGANTALKQLETRIAKLGRTITVNLRVNEREGRRAAQQTNTIIATGNNQGIASGAAIAALQRRQSIQKSITTEAKSLNSASQSQLKVQDQIAGIDQKILDGRKRLSELNKKLPEQGGRLSNRDLLDAGLRTKKAQAEAQKVIKRVEDAGLGPADAGKEYKRFYDGLPARAKKSLAEIDNANRAAVQSQADDLQRLETRRAQLVNRSVAIEQAGDARVAASAKRAAAAEMAEMQKVQRMAERNAERRARVARGRRRQKTFKGLTAGAGAAAAIATNGVPVLGSIGEGALLGSAFGKGKAGLVAGGAVGAVVGLGTAFAQVTGNVTEFANELDRQQRALANTVATSQEYDQALKAIDQASNDFLVPIGQATEQFTKLNAAARSSGFTVKEVEKVYRGLAAANTALGGDSQKLQGILLATQQIFSKGKVQAEELRGQLGERLPGAFALFAKAVNKTPAELDKALNDGKVTLEDFVTFTDSLLTRYEGNAKKIADAPENAAQRLALAMDALKKSMAPILQDIGNMFTNLATSVVKQLTRMFDAINQARTAQAIGLRREAQVRFFEASSNLQNAQIQFKNSDKDEAALTRLRNATEGYAMAQRSLASANKEVARLKLPFSPTGTPVGDKPKPLPTNTKTGSGSQSKPQDTVARTQALIAEQRQLLDIERQKFDFIGKREGLEQFAFRREKLKATLKKDMELIDQKNITAQSKLAEIEFIKLKHATNLQTVKNDEKEFTVEQTRAFEDQVTQLERALALDMATTEEKRRQLELEHALADVDNNKNLDDGQKAKLKALLEQRKELGDRNADPIFQYMTQLQNSITDTRGQIVSLAQTIESELATAMTSAVTGLIDGTTTVEEAFSSMLKNIGKAFIEMAMKILAQQAVLAILSAFGGGNLMGGDGYYNKFTGLGTAGPNFGLALGGPVTPKKPYLVGETGPELFIPSESGIIGTNAMFDAAAGAIKSGASVTSPEDAENDGGSDNPFAAAASALVNTNNTVQSSKVVEMQMAQNAAIENPEPIDVRFQSTVINNVSYVSVEEFQAGLTQTANRARSMTLKDLRNKPSTRRSTGVA